MQLKNCNVNLNYFISRFFRGSQRVSETAIQVTQNRSIVLKHLCGLHLQNRLLIY